MSQNLFFHCYECSKPIETRDFIQLNCCGKKNICKSCEPLFRENYGRPLLGHNELFICCPECSSFEPVPYYLAMQLISRNYVPRNFQEIIHDMKMTPEEKDSVQPYIEDLEKRQERLQRLIREEQDTIEAMIEEMEDSIYNERRLKQR
jgi:hypothetical protein